jgi:hypothetical protein
MNTYIWKYVKKLATTLLLSGTNINWCVGQRRCLQTPTGTNIHIIPWHAVLVLFRPIFTLFLSGSNIIRPVMQRRRALLISSIQTNLCFDLDLLFMYQLLFLNRTSKISLSIIIIIIVFYRFC